MSNKILSLALMYYFVLIIAEIRFVISKPINQGENNSPIQISSVILTVEDSQRYSSPESKPESNGKYKVNGGRGVEKKVYSEIHSNEFLRFVGAVGSGHIYVPTTGDKHFANVNDGLLSIDSNN
ncbi:uncharacterized protein LOC129947994 [Eupeodes corollae]|uniref:uncharacterized protein LOC129947994 n=1 Tax=Eupeodes corollae TaxID=290404 RepID=UPI00248FA45B|nr:uncharacterized protein LOC129947994 [Eupeodes corollae]